MGDYLDGKKGPVETPVPGKPQQYIKETKIIEKQTEPIDIDALANKIISAIGNKAISTHNEAGIKDDFDETASLDQLASAMSVNRSENKSNFDNLGNVIKTKKDSKETDKTIDILANLDSGD